MININDFPERFSSKVEIVGDCWIWKGAQYKGGYGAYCLYDNGKKKMVRAHRYSWTFINGVIPQGMVACHKCDNPSCVNPEHIFVGTQKENICDMIRKGRNPRGDNHFARRHPEWLSRGENHVQAILTDEQVQRIREEYRPGKPGVRSETSLTGLAEKYGVCFQQISRIVNNQRRVDL